MHKIKRKYVFAYLFFSREVCAVESEFQLEQVSDIRRSKEIMARLAGDQSPMGRFVWGNLKTLKDGSREKGLNLRNELLEFFNSEYLHQTCTSRLLTCDFSQTGKIWKITAAGPPLQAITLPT